MTSSCGAAQSSFILVEDLTKEQLLELVSYMADHELKFTVAKSIDKLITTRMKIEAERERDEATATMILQSMTSLTQQALGGTPGNSSNTTSDAAEAVSPFDNVSVMEMHEQDEELDGDGLDMTDVPPWFDKLLAQTRAQSSGLGMDFVSPKSGDQAEDLNDSTNSDYMYQRSSEPTAEEISFLPARKYKKKILPVDEVIPPNGRMNYCKLCNSRVVSQSKKLMHASQHAGINRYRCSRCAMADVRRDRLLLHVKNCGGEEGRIVDDIESVREELNLWRERCFPIVKGTSQMTSGVDPLTGILSSVIDGDAADEDSMALDVKTEF